MVFFGGLRTTLLLCSGSEIDEDPGAPTPKLASHAAPRRLWHPSDADARSPRPLSAAETAIAAGPFAEGVLSTARRGPCRLSGRAPSSHQVAVTAAVQADFWTAVRVHRLTVHRKAAAGASDLDDP